VRLLLAVHSARHGGAQAMALVEARRLAEDFELVIAVPRGPLRPGFARTGALVRGSPSVPLWPVPVWRWVLQGVRTGCDAVRLARLIRRRGIRLVVVNSTVLLSPVLAARLAGVPVAVHAREWPRSRRARSVMRLHARLADTVIAISEGIEANFRGSARARLLRIPDGIEIGPPAPASALARPVRLVVVGGLNSDRGKGQDVAVEAVALLARRGVQAMLDVVGPIQDRAFADALAARARELGVGPRVRVLGHRDDVAAILRRSDILLFCSRRGADVTPLVLMEALAAQRPVVATRVGSVDEVVVDGETGLLVEPEDPRAVADAVARLVTAPDEARSLAAAGRRRIAARYDVADGLAALVAEVERLLQAEKTESGDDRSKTRSASRTAAATR
jgi:glycosyltransferase involved in cell wall biosynthesis